MYRYNFFIHFYKSEEYIVFLYNTKTISITYNEKLFQLLEKARSQREIKEKDIYNSWIWSKIIDFLLEYKIFLDNKETNTWWEALEFHKLSSNPNKVDKTLSNEQIEYIYKEHEKKYNNKGNIIEKEEKDTSISSLTNNYFWSLRCKHQQSNIMDIEYLESTLFNISQRKNNKKVYWSWWWFYSIDQIVITRSDITYTVSWLTWTIRKEHKKWVFMDASAWILKDDEYSIDWYNAIVFLVAHTQHVFEKYWNRWYRFIMLESWALWFLYRTFYAKRWYLELWWYEDELCLNAITKSNLIKKSYYTIITHTILLHW